MIYGVCLVCCLFRRCVTQLAALAQIDRADISHRYIPQIYHGNGSSSSRLYLNDSLSTLAAKSANNRRNKSVFKRILTGVRHNVVSLKWLAILCDHILYSTLYTIYYAPYIVYIIDYTLVKHTGNMLRIADKSKSKQRKGIYYIMLHI